MSSSAVNKSKFMTGATGSFPKFKTETLKIHNLVNIFIGVFIEESGIKEKSR